MINFFSIETQMILFFIFQIFIIFLVFLEWWYCKDWINSYLRVTHVCLLLLSFHNNICSVLKVNFSLLTGNGYKIFFPFNNGRMLSTKGCEEN